jgi:phage terminase small subunit
VAATVVRVDLGNRLPGRAVDFCVTWARIEQGERALSREGVIVAAARADRGSVRNPWSPALNQYRAQFRALAAELGLTPSAASRIERPTGAGVGDGGDDPFD